jgi:hypothetical protein
MSDKPEMTPFDKLIQSGVYDPLARGYYLGRAIELIMEYTNTGNYYELTSTVKEAINCLQKYVAWMEPPDDDES